MKLCADCKHVRNRTENQAWWECDKTASVRATDGGTRYDQCNLVRLTERQCGVEAKWFEQRDGT